MTKTSKMHNYAGKLREDGDLAYTDCIGCPELGISCNGDNLGALDGDSLRAFIILMMEHNGWSHSKTAEIADIPKGTFDNWISGITKELRWDTAFRIIRAVCKITPAADDSCPLKSGSIKALKEKADSYDRLQARFDRLAADDRSKIEHLKQQNADQSALIKEYMQFFRRKNAFITILSILLGIAVCIIISALLIDTMNQNIGFFWVK